MTSFDLTCFFRGKNIARVVTFRQLIRTQGRNAREQAHWQKAQEPEQENQAM